MSSLWGDSGSSSSADCLQVRVGPPLEWAQEQDGDGVEGTSVEYWTSQLEVLKETLEGILRSPNAPPVVVKGPEGGATPVPVQVRWVVFYPIHDPDMLQLVYGGVLIATLKAGGAVFMMPPTGDLAVDEHLGKLMSAVSKFYHLSYSHNKPDGGKPEENLSPHGTIFTESSAVSSPRSFAPSPNTVTPPHDDGREMANGVQAKTGSSLPFRSTPRRDQGASAAGSSNLSSRDASPSGARGILGTRDSSTRVSSTESSPRKFRSSLVNPNKPVPHRAQTVNSWNLKEEERPRGTTDDSTYRYTGKWSAPRPPPTWDEESIATTAITEQTSEWNKDVGPPPPGTHQRHPSSHDYDDTQSSIQGDFGYQDSRGAPLQRPYTAPAPDSAERRVLREPGSAGRRNGLESPGSARRRAQRLREREEREAKGEPGSAGGRRHGEESPRGSRRYGGDSPGSARRRFFGLRESPRRALREKEGREPGSAGRRYREREREREALAAEEERERERALAAGMQSDADGGRGGYGSKAKSGWATDYEYARGGGSYSARSRGSDGSERRPSTASMLDTGFTARYSNGVGLKKAGSIESNGSRGSLRDPYQDSYLRRVGSLESRGDPADYDSNNRFPQSLPATAPGSPSKKGTFRALGRSSAEVSPGRPGSANAAAKAAAAARAAASAKLAAEAAARAAEQAAAEAEAEAAEEALAEAEAAAAAAGRAKAAAEAEAAIQAEAAARARAAAEAEAAARSRAAIEAERARTRAAVEAEAAAREKARADEEEVERLRAVADAEAAARARAIAEAEAAAARGRAEAEAEAVARAKVEAEVAARAKAQAEVEAAARARAAAEGEEAARIKAREEAEARAMEEAESRARAAAEPRSKAEIEAAEQLEVEAAALAEAAARAEAAAQAKSDDEGWMTEADRMSETPYTRRGGIYSPAPPRYGQDNGRSLWSRPGMSTPDSDSEKEDDDNRHDTLPPPPPMTVPVTTKSNLAPSVVGTPRPNLKIEQPVTPVPRTPGTPFSPGVEWSRGAYADMWRLWQVSRGGVTTEKCLEVRVGPPPGLTRAGEGAGDAVGYWIDTLEVLRNRLETILTEEKQGACTCTEKSAAPKMSRREKLVGTLSFGLFTIRFSSGRNTKKVVPCQRALCRNGTHKWSLVKSVVMSPLGVVGTVVVVCGGEVIGTFEDGRSDYLAPTGDRALDQHLGKVILAVSQFYFSTYFKV